MRLATACLLLLSTTNNNTPVVVLVNGFQFNPLNHIITTRNNQNVGTPQISSTSQSIPTTTIISQSNTITASTTLSAKNGDNESSSGFGKKKGRPKPPPRRSPTKDIKQAMAANDLVRVYLLLYVVFCVLCVYCRYYVVN